MRKNLLLLCGILLLLSVTVEAQTPSCPMGYYWDTQQCENCSMNCSSCDANNKCKDCMDGYYKDGDMCKSCGITGVKTCCTVNKDSNALRALSCMTEQGYVLQGSVCIKPDENCKTRIPKSYICSECQDGYVINQDNLCVMPKPTIANCRVYTNQKVCKMCNDNYYLSVSEDPNTKIVTYECLQCDENCLCKSKEKRCESCMAQVGMDAIYKKEEGETIQCLKCYYPTENNALISRPLTCTSDQGCKDGTCPSNSLCIKDGDGQNVCKQVSNCAKPELDTGTPPGLQCQECNEGFYLGLDKTCKECLTETETQNANTKDATTTLRKCTKPDSTSNDGVWLQCPHKSSLTQPHVNQYYLTDLKNADGKIQKACKENTKNCQMMLDFDGNCQSCYQELGHILKDSECKPCSSVITNCAKCALKSGSSTDYLCDTCSAGYYLSQDKSRCIAFPNNVVTCTTLKDSTDQLAGCTCAIGYKLVKDKDNQCEVCSKNFCKSCGGKADQNTMCKECKDGYGLIGQECKPCSDQCRKCDGNQEICKECMAGNFLMGNFCSPMRSQCSAQDKDGCQTCKYNAYLSNQHCLACIDDPENFKAYNNIFLDDKCPKIDNNSTCTSIAPPTPNPSSNSTSNSNTTNSSGSNVNPSNSTNSTSGSTSTTSSSTIYMVYMVLSIVILSLF